MVKRVTKLAEDDDGLYAGLQGGITIFIHKGKESTKFFHDGHLSYLYVGNFKPREYKGNYQISGAALIKW